MDRMNDIYREAFVFDCALAGRKFYLPRDGKMKLQFFHVQDLCRLMDAVLNARPARHIFNAGNKDTISVRDLGGALLKIAGKQAELWKYLRRLTSEIISVSIIMNIVWMFRTG